MILGLHSNKKGIRSHVNDQSQRQACIIAADDLFLAYPRHHPVCARINTTAFECSLAINTNICNYSDFKIDNLTQYFIRDIFVFTREIISGTCPGCSRKHQSRGTFPLIVSTRYSTGRPTLPFTFGWFYLLESL